MVGEGEVEENAKEGGEEDDEEEENAVTLNTKVNNLF